MVYSFPFWTTVNILDVKVEYLLRIAHFEVKLSGIIHDFPIWLYFDKYFVWAYYSHFDNWLIKGFLYSGPNDQICFPWLWVTTHQQPGPNQGFIFSCEATPYLALSICLSQMFENTHLCIIPVDKMFSKGQNMKIKPYPKVSEPPVLLKKVWFCESFTRFHNYTRGLPPIPLHCSFCKCAIKLSTPSPLILVWQQNFWFEDIPITKLKRIYI